MGSNQYDHLSKSTRTHPDKWTHSFRSNPSSFTSYPYHLLSSPSNQQQSYLTQSDQRMEWNDTPRQHPGAYLQNPGYVDRETSGLSEPSTDTHRQRPAATTQDLGPMDRETQGLADPRSSLRKLLDFLQEMRDHDPEKCLNDYKKMMESTDPMALTREEEYLRLKPSPYRTEADHIEADRLKQEVVELRQKFAELGHEDKGSNTTDTIQKELQNMKKGYDEEKKRMIAEFKEALELQQVKDLEKETQVQEQIEKLTQDLKAKDEIILQSERRKEQFKKALKEAHEEINKQEKEKTEALTRLSKEMGSKLSEKNPNITDLSDSNRPTKISEKYSELYDNEWTDALETLTSDTGIYTEESAIQVLLTCIQNAYSFCQRAAKVQIENLKKALVTPSTRSRSHETSTESVNPQAEKMLEEIRKSQIVSGDALMKEFEYADGFKPVLKKLPQYTTKCLELCWLMNMHDPPVAIGNPPAKHSIFDGTFYKEYTRSGTVVEFVVWLPLLLHENGPLLQKGVVQPVANMNKSIRQKSANRELSVSPTKSRQRKERQTEDTDPLVDDFFESKHHTAGSQTTQGMSSVSGIGQDRGTHDYLYGERNPSTLSYYNTHPTTTTTITRYNPNITTTTTARYTSKSNPSITTTSTGYESTGRQRRPHTSTNYGSGGGLTSTRQNVPLMFQHHGRQYVSFGGNCYTYDQWMEMERRFLPDTGSSDA